MCKNSFPVTKMVRRCYEDGKSTEERDTLNRVIIPEELFFGIMVYRISNNLHSDGMYVQLFLK